MKAKKREARKAAAASRASKQRTSSWWYAGGLFILLYAGFQAYGPVLYGPFVFDDRYLPFNVPNFPTALRAWVTGVRPLLMFTYWINYQLSGLNTLSYHLFNVLFHVINSLLVFLIVRKVLNFSTASQAPARTRVILAAFAAGLFLLHPVQTESVSYVASRSENLSLLFLFGAFTVFLYHRRPDISWREAFAILFLFACAVTVKEHTVALVGLLLLTDYFWNPGFSFGGIKRNWRLYVLMSAGAAGGLAFVWRIIRHASSAGFSVKEFTWYQYFFTQCRAFFLYLRLFFFPVGQTVDYDFPISRTIFSHGAIFGLLGILLLAGAAFYFRRRYPLASYGFFAFMILLAPTSSFVPIQDPVAERRLYLAMIGLLFIVVDALQRIKAREKTLAAALAGVLVVAGILTYNRNYVWSDDIALWKDAVQKSPHKARDHFQLAYAYYAAGRCDLAVPEYQDVARLEKPGYDLLVDWALAYDCLRRPEQALEKLRQAARLEPRAHVYSMIGMVYAKEAKWTEALDALATAEKIDPNYAMLYVYRGGVYASTNQLLLSLRNYQRALELDPANGPARQGLETVEARLATRR